ncbi:MAG: ROK family protein [Acidimicrobiia bacterium]|nr:MAG: ROK family protein [Acidimicrobiia bacterium]
MAQHILGIDIGGTGIKGGVVDLADGSLVTDRFRVDTPRPATPQAVAAAVRAISAHHSYEGTMGVAYPGIIRNGIALLAANVDASFLGVDVDALFTEVTGQDVHVMNDGDAAAVGEMQFGAAAGEAGTVLFLGFGTGIASALFREAILVPNMEFGHLEFKGMDAEHYCAASARKREGLSYEEWAGRVNEYLAHVEMLLSPDVIIFGGGVSKKWERFGHFLHTEHAQLRQAELLNNAGIAGAAHWAHRAATAGA